METTNPVPYTLTADDIKALAKITSITFRREEITLNREVPAADGWDSTTQYRTIALFGHVTDYRAHTYSRRPVQADYYCYTSLYTFTPGFATLVNVLKAGDTISLDWQCDNNTSPLDKAGMHADELRLKVSRGKHSFDILLTYHVTGIDGSRMCELSSSYVRSDEYSLT